MKIQINLVFEKATKNTLRYQEQPQVGQSVVLQYVYIRKEALQGQPDKLTMTIED